ncbi:MAG: hypothetical protein M3Y56_12895 [Armatimonadota bacterium]|nr:hypothetical protein [Armatimonadota bacterium]
MWLEVWRYGDGPRQKILVNVTGATICIKRLKIPFGPHVGTRFVAAEYPNGKYFVLSPGSFGNNNEVLRIIRRAIEEGYNYLDLTELGC